MDAAPLLVGDPDDGPIATVASRTNPDGTAVRFEDYDDLGRYGTIRPAAALADTFTQADGTAPDNQKWTSIGSPTVSGNKLTLPTGSGNVGIISSNRVHPDRDVTFAYKFADVTTANKASMDFVVRNQSSPTSSFVQVRFAGTDLKVWVWDPAAGEPTAPSLDTTETTVTNGASNRILVSKWSGAGANTVTVDDFTDIDPTHGEAPLATYTYDPDGNVTSAVKANGVSQTWSYHPTTGQLTQLHNVVGSTSKTHTLTYDSSGDLKTAAAPGDNSWTYTYDQAGQLKA